MDAVGEAVLQLSPLEDARLFSHGLSAREIVHRIPSGTEIVGLSCMFSHEWPLMRSVITQIRNHFPLVKIVAGGEHVTALPEFSLRDCPALDYCVLGEGEETMVELIAVLESRPSDLDAALSKVHSLAFRRHGVPTRTPPRSRIRRVDDLPLPAWDLIPLENYLANELGFGVNRGRSIPILATRGCPYQCTFCSNPMMWTTRWVARDPDKVLAEIDTYREQYRAENFDFYDLTAIVKRDWIVRFATRILEQGRRFTWQLPSGTRSEAIDDEVSGLLYEAGCRNVSYAPESGSPAVLRRIKKKVDLRRMRRSMRGAIRNGINVKANIILGFPDETHGEVWQTMLFIVQLAALGVHDISISPFCPYPGSELFERLVARGALGEPTDRYFYSLVSYTDLLHTVSYGDHVGDRALAIYRTFGLLLFYGLSYLLRPHRFVRTVLNAFRDHQESRGEMWIRETIFRLRHARSGIAE